jgi:putative endonuclease
MFFVYILRTDKNTLYTGYTVNLQKRLQAHKSKASTAAKYLRKFKSFNLVYSEEFLTKSEALKREAQIKKLTKLDKENLISGFCSNPFCGS